jgi:hypothetical protein
VDSSQEALEDPVAVDVDEHDVVVRRLQASVDDHEVFICDPSVQQGGALDSEHVGETGVTDEDLDEVQPVRVVVLVICTR